MEAFVDGDGVAFADYRDLLPKRAGDFPPMDRVTDSAVLRDYHWTWKHCQACGRNQKDGAVLEAHHIVGGCGRSDERTNLLMLCRAHHLDANGSRLPLGVVLWCKWRTDQFNLSWVRLAVLRRSFLPDPVASQILATQYNQRIYRTREPWAVTH